MAKQPPDPLFTFHGEMDGVHCIYFDNKYDGRSNIYCGTESGHVHVWDAQMLRQLTKIKIGSLPCLSILRHDHFITQEKGGDIIFWKETDNSDWEQLMSFQCGFKMFCKIILFNSVLIHPVADNRVKFLDLSVALSKKDLLKSEGIVSEFNDKLGMAMCSQFSTQNNCLLICFENGSICLVDPTDGRFRSCVKYNSECPMCIDYNDSGNFGIIGYNSDDLIKISLNGSEICEIRRTKLTNPGSSSVSIRNDGIIFVVGTWNGSVKYFSSKTMKLLAVLNHHSQSIECLKFIVDFNQNKSEDELKVNYLLAGSRDGRISLWNLYSN